MALRNTYSEYLGRGAIPGSIAAAEIDDAIGGYLPWLTIAALTRRGPTRRCATRGRAARAPGAVPRRDLPHGSGAFRASYLYWTEFLASHGRVMACDHAGSARYTN